MNENFGVDFDIKNIEEGRTDRQTHGQKEILKGCFLRYSKEQPKNE
jgi:hypothetical protein